MVLKPCGELFWHLVTELVSQIRCSQIVGVDSILREYAIIIATLQCGLYPNGADLDPYICEVERYVTLVCDGIDSVRGFFDPAHVYRVWRWLFVVPIQPTVFEPHLDRLQVISP